MPNLIDFHFKTFIDFIILQGDNENFSLRLGGEGKKSRRQGEVLVEGLTHFFLFCKETRRTSR